jgi:hypothetical protein
MQKEVGGEGVSRMREVGGRWVGVGRSFPKKSDKKIVPRKNKTKMS